MSRTGVVPPSVSRAGGDVARSGSFLPEGFFRVRPFRRPSAWTALVPLTGPGVEITLDDAPTRPDGTIPMNARPDDLVIHQSDVQAVVNAIWAAGADGVAIMDLRLIATSAVRCVGNVLLLQGRTYSPPFVITAIAEVGAVKAQLAASPQVAVLQQAVNAFGLTFTVRARPQITVPEYTGSLDLQYASAR